MTSEPNTNDFSYFILQRIQSELNSRQQNLRRRITYGSTVELLWNLSRLAETRSFEESELFMISVSNLLLRNHLVVATVEEQTDNQSVGSNRRNP